MKCLHRSSLITSITPTQPNQKNFPTPIFDLKPTNHLINKKNKITGLAVGIFAKYLRFVAVFTWYRNIELMRHATQRPITEICIPVPDWVVEIRWYELIVRTVLYYWRRNKTKKKGLGDFEFCCCEMGGLKAGKDGRNGREEGRNGREKEKGAQGEREKGKREKGRWDLQILTDCIRRYVFPLSHPIRM